jgi:hypothetical protein
VVTSVICLSEPTSTSLICAMVMILGGIAIGTVSYPKGVADRQGQQPARGAA